MSLYRALIVQTDNANNISREQIMLNTGDLPPSELLIEVKYSALNYYDALVLSGYIENLKYPIVGGIDAAGIVIDSKSDHFSDGDEVIVTGLGLGVNLPGGFGSYISIPAENAIAVPMGLNMRSAMAFGTAGVAAGIGALDLLNTGVVPEKHKIAITGASCDMGAVATAIMAHNNYNVTAFVADVNETGDYVKKLGAAKIEPLSNLNIAEKSSYEYDGIIDSIGGTTLASIINFANYNSTVVVAGYNDDMSLKTSLFPFVDRGINLTGVNAISCSTKVKTKVWQKLASDWKVPQLDWLCTEISFDELDDYVPLMLQRKVKGRIVINHKI